MADDLHDYGYDFDFPREYHPARTKDADKYYFCEKTFKTYVQIIQTCVFHIKGSLTGQPLILEKWQLDIIAAIFGLLHKETNQRRYSEVFLYVPRKNGKSMLCSAFVIAYLIVDAEKGKEVVSVAGSSDQASLIYKPIRVSLKNKLSPLNSPKNKNPNNQFKVLGNPRKIISLNELNTYIPLTADAETNHGLNVSFSVMDEIHTWKQKQGAALYEAIVTSMGMRQSPLNIIITTADTARDSICNDKFNHAKNVANGSTDDPSFLPILYYLDKEDDWKEPANWYKVCPQLGKSIKLDFYEKGVAKAERDPTYTNSFKRLYLNIQTQTESKFLDYLKWCDLEDKDRKDLRGLDCYGGLDLASKSDLCSFVLEFPVDGKYYVMSKMWIPRGHKNFEFYKDKGWVENGDVVVTEGNAIDFKKVKQDIVKMCEPYNVAEIGFDPWFATELVQSLHADYGLTVIEIPQTAKNLSEPLKDIAASIQDEKFLHDGNTCASWQVGNATAKEMDNGAIKLVKPKGNDSTLLKVDFVAAFSMAHNRVLFNIEEDMTELLASDDYSFL